MWTRSPTTNSFPLPTPHIARGRQDFMLLACRISRTWTFRAEGYLTPRRTFPGFYYFNVHYLSGYTNDRQLLGSWIGRESNGYQLWSTWWLSPRSSVQLRARDQNASSVFLRGGSLRDLSISTDLALSSHWQLSAAVQQERWRFPLLSTATHQNVTTTIQLSFHPKAGEL